MKKSFFISIVTVSVATIFQGCLFPNSRGVSSSYYNDCSHYYDSRGIYHNKCDENIIEYNDIGTVVTSNSGEKSFYIGF